MRKVSFVVFDIDNSIIDRFNLDLITDINGVGFKLKLSTIDGDIESIVTKVVQDKQEVKFKIHFINRAYEKSTVLEQWLEKYSTISKRMALEYTDGVRRRYTEGKVISLSKTEKDEYGQLIREVTFKPLTPFFSHIENVIKIKVAAVGKSYPYRYPYSYGKNVVENNEINNPYILDVPVTVTITGSIYEPTILLLDEDNIEYSRIKFTGLTLSEGQYLIINSAERKIWFFNGVELQDYTAETDPRYDTFLRAKSGLTKISVNLQPTDTGELIGSWRQYGL
jgi:hypothetical protein